MKIDRLIGIITTLQQNQKVTAPFLAEKFEVSRRTINRDIEDFITAIYDASAKYKLVEEYGPDSFTVLPDGQLYTKWGFTNPEEAVLRFLGFGDKVKVIEPQEMVERMKAAIESLQELYA